MRLRDDIELTILQETGDIHAAEAVGFALEFTQDSLCALLGVDPELMKRFDDDITRACDWD